MPLPNYIFFIDSIAKQLRRAEARSCYRIDALAVADLAPHYWREEAASIEEWFIRTCRGLGLHATYNAERRGFVLELTRDAAHEDTITWPGKRPGD